jgi:hypothetical protein
MSLNETGHPRLSAEGPREVRALILQGLREHWGSIDPRYNTDLDDMRASHGHGKTLVASGPTRVVGTGTIVPVTEGTAEIVIEGGFVLARSQRDASVLRVLGLQMEKLTADAFDAAKLKQ